MSAGEGKKLTVPKFASFKPKAPIAASASAPAPKPAVAVRPDASPDVESGGRQEDRSRRHRSSRHADHHHRRHHDRQRSDSPRRSSPAPPEPASRSVRTDPENDALFVIDKKGDPLIARYGNDNSKIPYYHRSMRGRILGATGVFTFHRDSPREEFSLRGRGQDSRDRNVFKSGLRRAQPLRLRRPAEDDGLEHSGTEDFLPLRSPSKRKRDDQRSPSSGDEGPSYRSIHGKAKAHEFSDSELEYGSDAASSQDETAEIDPLRQRSIDLTRRVKDRPEDIDAWLDLVDHQDVLMRSGEGPDREVVDAEAKSFAEIKLSMLESALAHSQLPQQRERILVRIMREGSKVWSSKKLAKRWDEVSEEHPQNFPLWKARMDFEMTNIATFTFRHAKDRCIDRIKYLKRLVERCGPAPVDQLDSIYHEMVYVFLRVTKLMHDAGYMELAVAAWQGLLELNLNRATVDASPETAALDLFRDFWESEVPRIGEEGARGWAFYIQDGDAIDASSSRTAREVDSRESRDVYKAWAAAELRRSAQAYMPARVMDDDSPDDPFRVVMHNDIAPLLFVIPSPAFQRVRAHLVDAFLLFASFPPTFGASTWTKQEAKDMFLARGSKSFLADLLRRRNDDSVPTEEDTRSPPKFTQDGTCLAVSPSVLFSETEWFSYLGDRSHVVTKGEGVNYFYIVLNTLKYASSISGFEDLSEYYLSLEWMGSPESVKKTARRILKRRADLRVYNAYALAEYANGHADVARNVVATACDLSKPSEMSSSDERLLLTMTGVLMEMKEGKLERCLQLLTSVVEDKSIGPEATSVSPARVLKARQHLLRLRDDSLASRRYDRFVIVGECLTTLEYLTAQGGSEPKSGSQGNISAAMTSMWVSSDYLVARGEKGSLAHERLLQFAAWLLYHHASHGPFRRAHLREHLTQCIELFPSNSLFLYLFDWADTGLRIHDDVRDLLVKVIITDGQDCVSSRVFSIQHELERGSVHSTRAAFERALESETCKSNIGLWIAYLRFCYSRKELRGKAVELFYRAIRWCPWSKGLAMEAFTTLAKEMKSSELQAVFSTMMGKGLRVHVDLEEFVQERKGR